MKHFKKFISSNVCIKLYGFIIVFPFLTGEVYTEWNTRDYMKRDHSLLKPYQGKIIMYYRHVKYLSFELGN